jgi:hypothetical protein
MRIDESRDLKQRISRLSDEELLDMVEVEPFEYRREALDHARAELATRGIQFKQPPETSGEEANSTINEPQAVRKLTTCKNVAQAGLLKGLLTGSGIDCEIRGEYLSMASGELPFAECYPELWVVSDDEEFSRAKAILDEWESKDVEQLQSWICRGCGEENEGQFSSCWSCGRIESTD